MIYTPPIEQSDWSGCYGTNNNYNNTCIKNS